MTDVHTINREMIALWREGRGREAAALAARLPDGELVWGEHADLWWHACEELGDTVRDDDAGLARRLYQLALASHVKEGTMATGSGEGLASRDHQRRIEAKLAGLA